AAAIGGPLCLDDLRSGNLRCSKGSDLSRMDEIGQDAEGFIDVRGPIRDPDLVEVDPVGAEAAPRALYRFDDPSARRAAMAGVSVERNAELDGEHHVVASPAGQGLAENLF